MSLASIIYFFLTSYNLILIHPTDLCIPKVERGATITCNNTCYTCRIDCRDTNICRDTTINSGASFTTINCFGSDSCKYATMNIGTRNPDSILYKPEYNTFSINCPNDESCERINLNINGNFINGGILDAHRLRGYEQARRSVIIINLNEGQIFTLYCGDGSLSCDNMDATCIGGVCQCVGNECNDISGGGIEINSMYICIFI